MQDNISVFEELVRLSQNLKQIEERINRLEGRASTTEDAGPDVLTPGQAAELIQVSRSQVYEKCAAGELPSVKIGLLVRIPRKALMQWLEDNTNKAESHNDYLRAIRSHLSEAIRRVLLNSVESLKDWAQDLIEAKLGQYRQSETERTIRGLADPLSSGAEK